MGEGSKAFDASDIMRRLRNLERTMRELSSGRRLESSSVGTGGLRIHSGGNALIEDGGGLTVTGGGDITIDGGEFRVYHPSGTEMMLIFKGVQDQYQIYIRRDDGSSVMQLLPHGTSGKQFWVFHDISGSAVLSDDAEAGVGLARPWLAVQMHPMLSEPTGVYSYRYVDVTDISSKTRLWRGRAYVSHPRITIDGVWGQASGSNTTTYTLEVSGVQVGSWTEGGGLITGQRGPFDVSDLVGDEFSPVELFANASGSGLVACQVLGCYLRQS